MSEGARVRRGKHGVDAEIVRRRYVRSARNLVRLYLPLASEWAIYDNSGSSPHVIAKGGRGKDMLVDDARAFLGLMEAADAGHS